MAIAMSTNPIAFLTWTIHSPGLGSAFKATKYGKPRPSANEPNITNPISGFPISATSVKSATTTGPTHGAATMPTNSPITAAPATPARPPERLAMNCGTVISHAPNIDDASTSINTANPISTAGFCSHDPNILPLSAATTPSPEYMITRPRT